MENIEFIYNGNKTIIQCNLNDKLENICQKFATKVQVNLNELLFLYNGEELNLDLKLNKLKINAEVIKILVYNNNKKLLLKFNLTDINNNVYAITIDFSQNLDIIVECKDKLSQKIFKNSFSLEELKKKSKFFKIYDTVKESYNDIKSLSNQNSFFIQPSEKSINLGIKKQVGIAYDILFLLKEEPNLKDRLSYEIEKNKKLNQENNELKNLINKKDKIINDQKVIIENLEKEIKNLKDRINSQKKDVKVSEEKNIMEVVFNSFDGIDYSVKCKNTDKFSRIENLLYEKFPKYAVKENFFLCKGDKINRDKTLQENNIRDKDIILLVPIEE